MADTIMPLEWPFCLLFKKQHESSVVNTCSGTVMCGLIALYITLLVGKKMVCFFIWISDPQVTHCRWYAVYTVFWWKCAKGREIRDGHEMEKWKRDGSLLLTTPLSWTNNWLDYPGLCVCVCLYFWGLYVCTKIKQWCDGAWFRSHLLFTLLISFTSNWISHYLYCWSCSHNFKFVTDYRNTQVE